MRKEVGLGSQEAGKLTPIRRLVFENLTANRFRQCERPSNTQSAGLEKS